MLLPQEENGNLEDKNVPLQLLHTFIDLFILTVVTTALAQEQLSYPLSLFHDDGTCGICPDIMSWFINERPVSGSIPWVRHRTFFIYPTIGTTPH